MLFFQNYSNLYPPNKTLCAHKMYRLFKRYIINNINYLSWITSIAGNGLPSNNSKLAPPPVEI
ncbi:hypothetical protein [Spiroplasma endosymbiont of Dilophus febrilis]|uniref:hypothetical protein n=1 Tax=Spiroplasma endosymbiont of Dilophus febrilis TaxID=3066292 RepID=UPI00313AF1E6